MSTSERKVCQHQWMIAIIQDLILYSRKNGLTISEDSLAAAVSGVMFDLNLAQKPETEPASISCDINNFGIQTRDESDNNMGQVIYLN